MYIAVNVEIQRNLLCCALILCLVQLVIIIHEEARSKSKFTRQPTHPNHKYSYQNIVTIVLHSYRTPNIVDKINITRKIAWGPDLRCSRHISGHRKCSCHQVGQQQRTTKVSLLPLGRCMLPERRAKLISTLIKEQNPR